MLSKYHIDNAHCLNYSRRVLLSQADMIHDLHLHISNFSHTLHMKVRLMQGGLYVAKEPRNGILALAADPATPDWCQWSTVEDQFFCFPQSEVSQVCGFHFRSLSPFSTLRILYGLRLISHTHEHNNHATRQHGQTGPSMPTTRTAILLDTCTGSSLALPKIRTVTGAVFVKTKCL